MFVERLSEKELESFFEKFYIEKNRKTTYLHYTKNGCLFVRVVDCDVMCYTPLYQITDFELIPKSRFAKYDMAFYNIKKEWVEFMNDKFGDEYKNFLKLNQSMEK